jgi:hypothetical protein
MHIETVTGIDGDGLPISVTVKEATVLLGMKRTRMRIVAGEIDETDIDLRILRLMTYPDLMAATIEQSGFDEWPLSFEAFCALPDVFASQWEQAVYRLNPHWLPDYSQSAEEKKGQPSN